MKLTLKTVERKEVATPNGREPTAIKVGVQANEYGNKWLSCFETEYTKHWKAGDVVEVADVVQKGQYLNIALPRPGRGSTQPAPAGQPPAQTGAKKDVAAEMLAALKAIAGHCELIVRSLQRLEERNAGTTAAPSNGSADYRPGDEVRQPSGGSTEDLPF